MGSASDDDDDTGRVRFTLSGDDVSQTTALSARVLVACGRNLLVSIPISLGGRVTRRSSSGGDCAATISDAITLLCSGSDDASWA